MIDSRGDQHTHDEIHYDEYRSHQQQREQTAAKGTAHDLREGGSDPHNRRVDSRQQREAARHGENGDWQGLGRSCSPVLSLVDEAVEFVANSVGDERKNRQIDKHEPGRDREHEPDDQGDTCKDNGRGQSVTPPDGKKAEWTGNES